MFCIEYEKIAYKEWLKLKEAGKTNLTFEEFVEHCIE